MNGCGREGGVGFMMKDMSRGSLFPDCRIDHLQRSSRKLLSHYYNISVILIAKYRL